MSEKIFKSRSTKNIHKKAVSYTLKQLIDGISSFYTESKEKENDFNHDIGLLYCTASISSPRDSLLSNYLPNLNESVKRDIKKRFQENSRINFYQTLQNLDIGDKSLSEVRQNLESKFDNRIINFQENKFIKDSIEKEIYRLTNPTNFSRVENFSTIGEAVRKGSKSYAQKQREEKQLGSRFKFFLEYNRILARLKEI